MDRETARQEIRSRIRCEEYLEKSKSGLYCCPYCGSGKGNHKTGALKLYETNTWTCHACNRSGDVIDLYQQETGADYNTALSLLAQEIGVTIDPYRPTAVAGFAPARKNNLVKRSQSDFNVQGDVDIFLNTKTPENGAETFIEAIVDYTDYYRECRTRLNDSVAVTYLQKRGISIETAAAYWIGYDPVADPAQSNHPCPRLIIPTSKTHYIGRRIDGQQKFEKMNPKGSTPAIFNSNALYIQGVQEIFVTEGVFDALSVMEVGYTAIALNSATNANALIKQLEHRRTTATLILCPDNDTDEKTRERVKKEFATLAADLQRLNISYITADINAGYKDANEALTGNKTAFLKVLEQAKRQTAAKPDNVVAYIDLLMGGEIEKFRQAKDRKTGYSNLDAEVGGLYGGLYCIAATSSLGKTTFAHQMADQLAAAGHDVIFFSMEQSRLELVSKSLARITAQKDAKTAVTSLSIRRGYLPKNVLDAVDEYKATIADRLSIVEGNFNCNITFIGDYVRGYIKRTGCKPVVFIDYLQILQPAEDGVRRQSTKEMVDSTVTELKRISREHDITVFIISSVNRANYLTPIDFESLKESGGIEYTCDVIWGLQLQCLNDPLFDNPLTKIKEKREKIKQEKRAEPRRIELVCLKNRYGIANFSVYFDYYPKNDFFALGDGEEYNSFTAQRI